MFVGVNLKTHKWRHIVCVEPATFDSITSYGSGTTVDLPHRLRREELFSLRWNQIDPVRGIITTTKKTKSGRPRSVPLPDRSCSILPPFPGVDDFVLINPETKKRYVQMNKGFKAAVRRSGIEHVQWHDLRRTAGCHWLQRDGKSMEEVSILLGHSSVQVTEQRYAFLESEKVAASISARTKTGTAAAS